MDSISKPTDKSLPLSKGVCIDQISVQFDLAIHEAIQNGGRWPSIEDHLGDTTEPVRSELRKELLAVEAKCRQQQAERGDPDLPYGSSSETLLWQAGKLASRQTGNDSTSKQPVSPTEASVGHLAHIGRYRIQLVLGEGAFGTVYRAYDETLKRQVAIKVPHRRLVDKPEDIELYLEEAQVVAGLDHTNIVPVHDVGQTEDGLCYVVSKFIEGSDLARRIREQPLSHFESAGLVAAIAEALQHAHQHMVVHRDVKPANILIEATGKPYLADFGLALKEADFGEGSGRTGTPNYMSPEQARGEGHLVDGRADIFSLGVVFYELLTATRPFWDTDREKVLERIRKLEPCPPRQLDKSVPKELERICLKALSKRPSDRYSTALDMAQDLREFLKPKTAAYSTAKDLADGLRHFLDQQRSPTPEGIDATSIAPVAQGHRQDADAHRLCLNGRYYWNKRTEDGLRKSITCFYQALDKEPTYALAWASLADAYHQLGIWGHAPPTSACPRARSAALKAIELDDTLGEAYTALAVVLKDYDWDFDGAERAFGRALELNPAHALTHQWYGECLACMGKHTEAIAELRRAQDLDPLSINISTTVGRHGFFFARQYENATAQLRKTIETDPTYWIAHSFLGWVYLFRSRFADAVAEFETARRLDDNPETLACLGYCHATSGQHARAKEHLDALTELAGHRYVAPVNLALVYIGLGDKEQAFTWLEKARDDHSQWLSEIRVDPAFDPLRSDPRFADLLRRM